MEKAEPSHGGGSLVYSRRIDELKSLYKKSKCMIFPPTILLLVLTGAKESWLNRSGENNGNESNSEILEESKFNSVTANL